MDTTRRLATGAAPVRVQAPFSEALQPGFPEASAPSREASDPGAAWCAGSRAGTLLRELGAPDGELHAASGARARGLLALVLEQELLADADVLRRDLDEFVLVDELDRLLQRHPDRRG